MAKKLNQPLAQEYPNVGDVSVAEMWLSLEPYFGTRFWNRALFLCCKIFVHRRKK